MAYAPYLAIVFSIPTAHRRNYTTKAAGPRLASNPDAPCHALSAATGARRCMGLVPLGLEMVGDDAIEVGSWLPPLLDGGNMPFADVCEPIADLQQRATTMNDNFVNMQSCAVVRHPTLVSRA